jgi:flagellar hook-associated protein 3 FlgL
MLTRTLLADLNDVTSRLARTQSKLSSGKELEKPSDDPYLVSRALQFRGEVAMNEQYSRNVGEANAWQTATDSALSQMGDIALRARELLIQGATDSAGPTAREAIATEIDQLADSLKSAANSQYAGRYIFGGSNTLNAPYSLGGSDVYAGNGEIVKREIGPGVRVDLNVAGDAVVGNETSGLLFTLRTIAADLRAGNTAALQNADMTALDTAHETITTTRATVGARANRLDAAGARLLQLEEHTRRLLSETEDADMAKALVDFSMQQAVYQSALKSGAQIIQPSLMDFLR